MNAFVKKEIRLLLPSFLLAAALSFFNWLLPQDLNDDGVLWFMMPFVVCPMLAVMLSLNSFGGEINSATFSNLLSQPIERLKIWETKILLLVVSLLLLILFWFSPLYFHVAFSGNHHQLDLHEAFVVVAVFGLAVFSGGLWTVLLLRQVAAAFWFTLLVPGVILMLLVGFFSGGDDDFLRGLIVTVLGVYSLTGFFFARWLFLRAQDAQWSGGTIVMPEMRRRSLAKTISGTKRTWRPRAELWRKEVMLHQSQFVMAFALAALHLGVLGVRKFHDLKDLPDLKFVLETFWGLWLVMPLLVGCAAIAEERKLGTLTGQLCLSVKQRTQFGIKFLVVLELSVLFGVVMPLLLEGTRICPGVHFQLGNFGMEWHGAVSTTEIFIYDFLATLNGLTPLLPLMCIALLISAISFYASSLARNTLQTLAPAALGLLLTFLLWQMSRPEEMSFVFHVNLLWRGNLIYLIGVPVLTATLVFLAYRNFKQASVGWRTYLSNGLTWIIMLALVVLVTAAVYNRLWEKLTAFEPPHGVAKLTLSNPATLQTTWNTLSVRLPDGRIWSQDYTSPSSPTYLWKAFLGNSTIGSYSSRFQEGSNWIKLIRNNVGENVGIKMDGTLWVSADPPRREQSAEGDWTMSAPGKLMQFGSDTNWSSLVVNDLNVLLVKTNGTLWRWGVNNWDLKFHEWPGLSTFTPRRLGIESNWAGIFEGGAPYDWQFFAKKDGSLWMQWNYDPESEVKLERGFSLGRVSFPQASHWTSLGVVWNVFNFGLGVRSDETFRIWSDQRVTQPKGTKNSHLVWKAADLQIGKDTNWLAMAACNDNVVTLKNDGTLWLWDFYQDNRYGWDPDRSEHVILESKPTRLGIHSDWIAIADVTGGVVSLAADGGLWFWPLASPTYNGNFGGTVYYNNGPSHFEPLLKMSRKPQFLGNIFAPSN